MAVLAETPVREDARGRRAVLVHRWAPVAALLSLPILLAAVAWSIQFREGLAVTGLNRPAFWGTYIVTFLFLVGLSHGAILVSVLGRVAGGDRWADAARVAELTAFLALAVGALNPILHLGRPHLFWTILEHPQPSSPVFWDLLLINGCLACCGGWLVLNRGKDIAARLEDAPEPLGRVLRHPLARAILNGMRAPVPVPVFRAAAAATGTVSLAALFSAYEVVTWTSPGAGSPARHFLLGFGPFWAGAVLSGLAAVTALLAASGRPGTVPGEASPSAAVAAARWLPAAGLAWALSSAVSLLIGLNAGGAAGRAVIAARIAGAGPWLSLAFALLLPASILLLPRGRGAGGAAAASLLALAGIWVDRYLLVTSLMTRPRMEEAWGSYAPSWVELSVMAGEFALFGLLFLTFTAALNPVRTSLEENAP